MPESRKTINKGIAIAVFGSPRRKGFSSRLHEAYLSTAHVTVRRFHIPDMDIRPCNGCLSCADTFRCVQRDSMDDFLETLRSARLITFSFPLYFSAMPGPLKTMIDRFQPLWMESRKMKPPCPDIEGKAFVTAGAEYRDMFVPSVTILRHLLNSIGGRFNREESVFCANLDTVDGLEKYKLTLDQLCERAEKN